MQDKDVRRGVEKGPGETPALSEQEKAIYEWQLWTPGFGEAGQRRLKAASVLISRCGGVGSLVAMELAAAGVGRLVIAHAGDIRPSDLNRQLLMSHDGIGTPRIESIKRRLEALNPRVEVMAVAQNITPQNAARLVGMADLVVDCAPMFQERFAMQDEAVRQGKPVVECALYDLEVQLMTIAPGRSACLRCLIPDVPPTWKRQFPVFGAVSGTAGCLAAMEAIKMIAGFGEPLLDRRLVLDLRSMKIRFFRRRRDPSCSVCGNR